MFRSFLTPFSSPFVKKSESAVVYSVDDLKNSLHISRMMIVVLASVANSVDDSTQKIHIGKCGHQLLKTKLTLFQNAFSRS